jgi:6-phosphogluconolactonase
MGAGRAQRGEQARVVIARDAEAMSVEAAAELAHATAQAREERGVAHVALSGGTTPVRAYELLAEELADWRAVELWFADERCVAPEDPESNYRLVADTLLAGAKALDGRTLIAGGQVHRMEGELGPERGAERYTELLRSRVRPDAEGVPALDVVVLGIGPEGHIASLFPRSRALADARALCLGVTDSPKPPPERITLGLPTLRAARRTLLLASGEGKAHALDMALGDASPDAPASLLRRERVTVLADEAAAGALARAPER